MNKHRHDSRSKKQFIDEVFEDAKQIDSLKTFLEKWRNLIKICLVPFGLELLWGFFKFEPEKLEEIKPEIYKDFLKQSEDLN